MNLTTLILLIILFVVVPLAAISFVQSRRWGKAGQPGSARASNESFGSRPGLYLAVAGTLLGFRSTNGDPGNGTLNGE